jgi:Josephin.
VAEPPPSARPPGTGPTPGTPTGPTRQSPPDLSPSVLGHSQASLCRSGSQGSERGGPVVEDESPPLAQPPNTGPASGTPDDPISQQPSPRRPSACSFGLTAEGSANRLLGHCAAPAVFTCPGPTSSQHRAGCDRRFCAEHKGKCPKGDCIKGRRERQQAAGASQSPRLAQATLDALGTASHSLLGSAPRASGPPAECPFHWERQQRSHCTLHTTNHLLDRGLYSVADFGAFAEELGAALAGLVPGPQEGFHDAGGNYDLQVMDLALTRAGLQGPPNSTSVLRSWPGNEHGLQGAVRAGAVGAVVVHRAARVDGRVTGGHFYCLRLHHPTGQWWNLDSLQSPVSGPQMLSAQEVASHLQRESRTHAPPTGAILLYSVPALDPVSHPVGSLASAQPPGHRPDPPGDSQPERPGSRGHSAPGGRPGGRLGVKRRGAGSTFPGGSDGDRICRCGAGPLSGGAHGLSPRHLARTEGSADRHVRSEEYLPELRGGGRYPGHTLLPPELCGGSCPLLRPEHGGRRGTQGTLDVYLLDGTAKLALQPAPRGIFGPTRSSKGKSRSTRSVSSGPGPRPSSTRRMRRFPRSAGSQGTHSCWSPPTPRTCRPS